MSDPIDELSSYPPLPTNQHRTNVDPTSSITIPVSDFRRVEARPIATDDGKYFILLVRLVNVSCMKALYMSCRSYTGRRSYNFVTLMQRSCNFDDAIYRSCNFDNLFCRSYFFHLFII